MGSSKNIRPPQHYSPVLNYLLLTDSGEPECYDEALQDENSSKWELAMKDEMDSLLGNHTWELTELPVGKKALAQQVENLHLEQLDVKTTFLHGDLEEDLYMIQSEGFIVQGQENLVCKLRKTCMALNKLLDSGLTLIINNLKKQLSKQFCNEGFGSCKANPWPDIAHAVGVVSRFMSRPGKQHWEAVKWILRYLKGSLIHNFASQVYSYIMGFKSIEDCYFVYYRS
ncbi:Retrovirus-related Pol polyprotein from transposon TNT 1-94 [Vitis vinifera]|uniref:Retrovirus-related Pol polyprotein from transposon TNT 1-94 n=1 Tax=Vitis vinifera TaxID=29760 RepID=A0A438H2N6_VITVI|nr:Retrovirus-related Pol polyprotein from transposon TNT 1-94 [Vitis vinifera]